MASRVVRRVRPGRGRPVGGPRRAAGAGAGRAPERAEAPGRDPARGPRPAAGGRRPAVTSSAAVAREGAATGVPRGIVQLLFDPEQLVVLRDPLAARRGAGLDLAA